MVLDAAAIFVGDDDPTDAEFLSIKSVKIPALRERTKDHSGGGAVMAIQIGMRYIEPLELTFRLEGFNERPMGRFMSSGPERINYTIRGSVRDLRTHAERPVRAIINGRMTKVEPGDFSKDQGIETDYQIMEILRYQLFIDNVEKYYFDYFAGPAGVRIDGTEPFRSMARNLGLL
jgi:P2 family phage contractile tail tube protein